MPLSNISCKTNGFQTWNQKCLICVILGFQFEKLLPYLKSAPVNSPIRDKENALFSIFSD